MPCPTTFQGLTQERHASTKHRGGTPTLGTPRALLRGGRALVDQPKLNRAAVFSEPAQSHQEPEARARRARGWRL